MKSPFVGTGCFRRIWASPGAAQDCYLFSTFNFSLTFSNQVTSFLDTSNFLPPFGNLTFLLNHRIDLAFGSLYSLDLFSGSWFLGLVQHYTVTLFFPFAYLDRMGCKSLLGIFLSSNTLIIGSSGVHERDACLVAWKHNSQHCCERNLDPLSLYFLASLLMTQTG